MTYAPPFEAPVRFQQADQALAHAQHLYTQAVNHLRVAMQRYVAGDPFTERVRACYPYVRMHTETVVMRQKAS